MSGSACSASIPVALAMGELGQNAPTGVCHKEVSVPAAAVMKSTCLMPPSSALRKAGLSNGGNRKLGRM